MRLIDADALIGKEWFVAYHGPDNAQDEEIIKCCKRNVEIAPTVDAVQVVRCKDCTYYHDFACVHYRVDVSHSGDYFCADGKLKR